MGLRKNRRAAVVEYQSAPRVLPLWGTDGQADPGAQFSFAALNWDAADAEEENAPRSATAAGGVPQRFSPGAHFTLPAGLLHSYAVPGLKTLRAVLLAEHVGRKRDGLV